MAGGRLFLRITAFHSTGERINASVARRADSQVANWVTRTLFRTDKENGCRASAKITPAFSQRATHSSCVSLFLQGSQNRTTLRRQMSRPPVMVHLHNFLGGSVTAIMGRCRDFTRLQLAPSPAADDERPPARTIQCVFLRRANNRPYEIRPIAVGTKGNQITREALGAFHTMTNANGGHRSCPSQVRSPDQNGTLLGHARSRGPGSCRGPQASSFLDWP